MAEEIGLLDGPFSLEWIDCETDVLEAGQDKRKKRLVVVPAAAEYANVVHVKFNIFYAIENKVHVLCGDVSGITNSHGQPTIAVEPEGSSKGAEVAGSFIEKKRIVLQRDIKFREKLVSRTALKDFTNRS